MALEQMRFSPSHASCRRWRGTDPNVRGHRFSPPEADDDVADELLCTIKVLKHGEDTPELIHVGTLLALFEGGIEDARFARLSTKPDHCGS